MLSQETTEKQHVLNNQGLELACCPPATELADELVRIVQIHSGVSSSSREEHSPGVCRKWIELEAIVLSDIRQTHKDKYHIFIFI